MLGEKEEQPFDRFNFLFGDFSASFFLSFCLTSKITRIFKQILSEEFVTIPGYENKFRALSNHVLKV